MKIYLSQSVLIRGLNMVSKGVSTKNTLEILRGILFEAYEGKLILTSNNLEIGIQTVIEEVDIERPGRIVIDARLFIDIIKKMNDRMILIEVDEYRIINIKSENVEFNIKGFEADDFPLPATVAKDHYRELSSDIFKEMVRKTSFAVSVDEDKPAYNGELLHIESRGIHMIAMDGFRLALKTYVTQTDFSDTKILLPGKSILEVSRMIQPVHDTIKLGFDEKHACFVIGETIVTTRLLKNDFINYEKIIPSEFSTTVKIHRDHFLDSLERATLVAHKNLIKLSIKDEIMEISSKNDEIGNLNESVHISLNGEPLEIAFNAKFFIDCLKSIDEEEIILHFNSALSPCVLQIAEDDSYTYLILPVRV